MSLLESSFIRRLMFDPFERIVYDYTGGLEDIRRAKVCMYLFFILGLFIEMLE